MLAKKPAQVFLVILTLHTYTEGCLSPPSNLRVLNIHLKSYLALQVMQKPENCGRNLALTLVSFLILLPPTSFPLILVPIASPIIVRTVTFALRGFHHKIFFLILQQYKDILKVFCEQWMIKDATWT